MGTASQRDLALGLAGALGSSAGHQTRVERVVELAREQLGMDVTYLSEWRDGQQVFRTLHGAGESFGLHAGEGLPLDDSYCLRVVDGRMPNAIPDTSAEPMTRDLPGTRDARIGAYLGVPVRLSNGRQYGMLCGLNHAAEPTLNQRDVRFMTVLASIIADQLEAESAAEMRQQEIRARIGAIIADGAFEIAFQPILALRTQRIAGYEALSRFAARPARPPDAWFAEAATVGLQVELELATAAAALALLPRLPAPRFLSINCSPATFGDPRLDRLLTRSDPRRIVLELSEQTKIDDYRAIGRRIDRLRQRGVQLAIDDAGAGYSSLRHVVQLAPELIKIDIGLVRSIDRDPARRALVAALVPFAVETGAQLIAEGIEEAGELAMLRSLGVTFGQGYLLGRPAPLAELPGSQPAIGSRRHTTRLPVRRADASPLPR